MLDTRKMIDRRNRPCRLHFEHTFQPGERRFLIVESAQTRDRQVIALAEIELFKSATLIVPEPGDPGEWMIGDIKRVVAPDEAQPLRLAGGDMTAIFFREGGYGGGVQWPGFPPKELQIEIVYNGFVPKKFSFFVEKIDVRKAKPRDVMAHLAELQKDHYAKSTIGRALSVIREVYAGFVRDELITTNPAREVKPPRMNGKPKALWVDEESMKSILNLPTETWEEKRDRVAVFLLFGLGWRRSEIARMRLEERLAGEFPYSELRLRDRGQSTCHGILKGSKEETVGVPDWVVKAVYEWCQFADIHKFGMALLPRWEDNPEPISDGMLYKIVKKMARRAGLDKRKVAPHGFRRSFITLSGEKGVDLKKRQLAVGHSSSATTEGYDKAREAASSAPGEVFAGMIKKRGRR